MSTTTDVVIEIRGGRLVATYSNDPGARFVVVDWDDLQELPPTARRGNVWPGEALATMPRDTREVYEQA